MTYLRPHLEYAVQTCKPREIGEINHLERVLKKEWSQYCMSSKKASRAGIINIRGTKMVDRQGPNIQNCDKD
jgi:hypothetical protein